MNSRDDATAYINRWSKQGQSPHSGTISDQRSSKTYIKKGRDRRND